MEMKWKKTGRLMMTDKISGNIKQRAERKNIYIFFSLFLFPFPSSYMQMPVLNRADPDKQFI